MNLTPPAPFVPPTEETRKSPLFDDGVMIRVPVTAFGKTLYFILDSGFTVSALDARHRSSLGASLREYRTITPLGTEAALPVFPCPPLAIAGHPLPLREIACVDLTMARWISGEPCDGILGADFFAGTTLQLDFDEKSIVVGEMP
ncbi:MAG TPA: aspartyl protease family protein, partial [Verrucomicrobiae bacterium]|nr:aspartyl protease family protein [Verrucomicrobiae bacterium]